MTKVTKKQPRIIEAVFISNQLREIVGESHQLGERFIPVQKNRYTDALTSPVPKR